VVIYGVVEANSSYFFDVPALTPDAKSAPPHPGQTLGDNLIIVAKREDTTQAERPVTENSPLKRGESQIDEVLLSAPPR
jgi:hypothetical protein